jgi:hypothetical protein
MDLRRIRQWNKEQSTRPPARNNDSPRLRVTCATYLSNPSLSLAFIPILVLLIWRPSEALLLVRPAQLDEAVRVREAAAEVVKATPSIPGFLATSPKSLWPNCRLRNRVLPCRIHSSVLHLTRKNGLSGRKNRMAPQQSARLERKLRREPNSTT